jgi:hypothetical protein
MTIKSALMRGSAIGVLITFGAATASQAADAKHPAHKKGAHHEAHASVASAELSEMRAQMAAQAAHMAELQARLDAQQAELQQAKAQSSAVAEQIETAQAQNADATAAVLASIPTQVATAVAADKPKTDAFYYKGLKITPGGFLAMETAYRSRAEGADVASNFNAIPFANSKAGHEDEEHFTGRQSRLSFLAEGKVNADTVLSGYGEFDFLGAAQTANPNESNSWNPRIRHLYGTLDMNNYGWHFLAGQTWSLATMNSKGITPRNEVTPPQIDAQYVPGFVWARQAQVRITHDFLDHHLWIALSAENAQTTFTGTAPSTVTSAINNGSNYYDGTSNAATATNAGGSAVTVSPTETCTTNGATPGVTAATLKVTCTTTAASVSVPTAANQSFNHIPDLVAKIAYEQPFQGKSIHLEAFVIGTGQTDRIGTNENNVYTGGFGAGAIVPVVPDFLDIQVSGLTGKGIGRYGTSQLPDATYAPSGRLDPLTETMFLAGGTLHATKMLDIYAFGGEEKVQRLDFGPSLGSGYGYGSPLINVAGCFTEGGSCSAATKYVEQVTAGFWQKVYQGQFGRAQFGVQYSYTERHAFSGADGAGFAAPIGNESMIFTSFRYYPF